MPFDLSTARPAEEVDPPQQGFDLNSAQPAGTPAQMHGLTQEPFEPGPLESAGRYLADWGTAMREPLERPAAGPTGLPLVDGAAGAADFAASAAADTATGVPRIAANVFRGARGAPYNPELFTRKPTTEVGTALQESTGAAFKPVMDALTAMGVDPSNIAAVMDVLGTVADVIGLGAGARGAKLGVRGLGAAGEVMADPPTGATRGVQTPVGVDPESVSARAAVAPGNITPDGGGLRRFGESTERARRLGYRVTPGQVSAKAHAKQPEGVFRVDVPGLGREGFSAPDFDILAAIDNQKRTNRFAAQELGISEITPMSLQFAKNPHNAVFNEVAQSLPVLRADWELGNAAQALGAARRSNPLLRTTDAVEQVRDRLLDLESVPTQQALDAIRSYRQDASKLFKQAEMGGSGIGVLEAEQAALAYRGAADALEAAIERQVGTLYPDLVPRLRDARTALAKIHNVEDAFDGVNVSAPALVKIGEKYPLSGYLGEIAAVAREFPHTMILTTGQKIPVQSQQGVINSLNLAARRAMGQTQGIGLLEEPFQNRFGRADPDFDPRDPPRASAGGSPFAEFTPPDPDVPGGADVMPPGSPLGPDAGAIGLGAEFDTLPEAEARPGDLTAETPPMGGSLPADTLPEILAALGLETAPEGRMGELDFTPSQIEPVSPLDDAVPNPMPGSGLADDLQPPLTDTELLDIDVQRAAAEFGLLDDAPPAQRGNPPPPPDEPLAALAEPDVPPQGGAGGATLVDELTTDEPAPRPAARDFEGDDTPELGTDEVELKGENRRVILRESNSRLNIQRTNVDPANKAQGFGQQNILDALAEAEKRGLPLDGGTTLTRDALRPWRSLKRKGVVEFDGDLDAIEKAIEDNGGVTKERPDGKPWITNVRRGPAG